MILENDIYRNRNPEIINKFLDSAKNIVVIDFLENATTSRADFVLPAATFAESSGTFVNNEGRAQRFFKVFEPQGEIQESWRWIRDLMPPTDASGETVRWENLDDILKEIEEQEPAFKSISKAAERADLQLSGQKIPRQSPRESGRTAKNANVDVNEPALPEDKDSPFSFSMEGYGGQMPSSLINRYWSPGWNSVQAVNKYQKEIGGQLEGGFAGKRLIEPKESAQLEYFTEIPDAFSPRKDEFLVVPAYHVFGSEELSVLSQGIAELSVTPYVAVNKIDAGRLSLSDGQVVEVTLNGAKKKMPVKITTKLAIGLAAVPAGLAELQWDGEPAWSKLVKV